MMLDVNLGPPAFLWRRFRTGKETWEILPHLIAKWTLTTIPEREPGVECARLCRSIPKDINQKVENCMWIAFMFWLVKRKENDDATGRGA